MLIATLAGGALAQSKITDGTGSPGVLPAPGALLDLDSTTRGLLAPRIAVTNAVTWGLAGGTPVEGMVVYNTTATTGANGLQQGLAVWKNARWVSVDETPYLHVNSTAIGNSTLSNSGAVGANSIAVGPNAFATGAGSVVLGNGAQDVGGGGISSGAVVIGAGAFTAGGTGSIPGGTVGYATVTIGAKAQGTGSGAVAIGDSSRATVASVAIGPNAVAGPTPGSNLGTNSSQIAIGSGARAGADSTRVNDTWGAIAIGMNAVASPGTVRTFDTMALGNNSLVTANRGVALGSGATASVNGGVALGATSISNRALAPTTGTIAAGSLLIPYNTTDSFLLGAVSVGGTVGAANFYRQITNVADGTQAQDAVTIRQLTGALQSFAVTPIKYFHANSSAADSLAVGAESVAVGPQTVVNGDNGIGMGNGAVVHQSAPGGIAIGQAATSHLADSIALGTQASAAAAQGVAIGAGTNVTQAGGVALGAGSVASTGAGVAGYVPPAATDSQRTAIGATTSTLAAVSVGDAATGKFRQITGVAAGAADSDAVNVAQLKAVQGTVAVIDQSTVKYDTNVDGTTNYNSVSLGGNNSTGPVSVHNVAPGVAGTDAVNVNQLNSAVGTVNNRINGLDDKINSNTKMLSGGIAASAAMAVVTPVEPGRYHVSGAVAGYNGQAGIGFNVLKRSDNGQTTLHAGVGWATGGSKAIVRVGFGFSFD
ncbi:MULTISPECIES: YadA family autotransporter adhesin [Variovorax]|uniref:YadA family autotransporter adhesin n=1 Tax=Variovorax TaxID=34072 RepID=UPI00286731C7|nr:YadA-like family protein [Variovorax sp. 3319]MDR6890558.1 hypothetical protein [Variovorax sp. 3319]